jgi:hypothetical protein
MATLQGATLGILIDGVKIAGIPVADPPYPVEVVKDVPFKEGFFSFEGLFVKDTRHIVELEYYLNRNGWYWFRAVDDKTAKISVLHEDLPNMNLKYGDVITGQFS